MSIAIATRAERAACHALLTRLLQRRGHVVPTAADEASLEAVASGFPRAIVARATIDGRIVGAGVVYANGAGILPETREPGWSLEQATTHARRWRVLTHLAVEPAHRGRGLGRERVAALEQEARAAGTVGIYGLAEDVDRPSGDFFERCDYTVLGLGESLPPLGGAHVAPQAPHEGRMFFKRLPRE